MPKRMLMPLTTPEVFGLFVSLLARYAIDAPGKTQIDEHLESHLGDDSLKRAVAGRLIENFRKIPIEQRMKELGDLAEPQIASFSEARFEAAISSMPTAGTSSVIFADDVSLPPLPPLNPLEQITLNFSGIFCSEETGDQLNVVGASDEILVITNTVVVSPEGQNVIRTEKHPLSQEAYDKVDTGNFRNGPLAACYQGRYTELSLVCTVMEHDLGDPDAYKEQIDLIVGSAFDVTSLLKPAAKPFLDAIKKLVAEAINWLIDTDDDIVETTFQVIEADPLRRLALQLPRFFVGQHKKLASGFPLSVEVVDKPTDILQHFVTSHSGGGGKYNVCFRLKRSGVGVVIGPPVLVPVAASVAPV